MNHSYSVTIGLEQNTDYDFLDSLRYRYGRFNSPAHVTVVPFIRLSPADLQLVKQQLRQIVARIPPFPLNFHQMKLRRTFGDDCVAIPIRRGGYLEDIWYELYPQ
jgi:hypothetical protein